MPSSPLLLTKELPALQYAATADHFDESWRAPLSTLLGLGRAAGADFIEFFLERVNYISWENPSTPAVPVPATLPLTKRHNTCSVSTTGTAPWR